MSQTEPLLFRFHRGTLEESMKTVIEIPNQEFLKQHIIKIVDCIPRQLIVRPYEYDERIGWDTHIVLMAIDWGIAVFPIGYFNYNPPWIRR